MDPLYDCVLYSVNSVKKIVSFLSPSFHHDDDGSVPWLACEEIA